MTTTAASLNQVKPIIDEYIAQDFRGIFLRPLSPYGFAIKTKFYQAYDQSKWLEFYFEGLDYIIDLNLKGFGFTEYYAAMVLRKMLTPFQPGYVDLLSPAGAGVAAVVYNYDGDVYASDESRMLAEMGVCVGELLKSLELRVANPAASIDLSDELAGFDLDEWLEEYRAIEQSLSSVLRKHNDAFASFSSIQKDAFSKIEAHVLATNQAEWNRLQKAHADANAQYDNAVDEEQKASDREQELRNDLQDHGVGAEIMNELIWAYLGHRELRLVAEDAG